MEQRLPVDDRRTAEIQLDYRTERQGAKKETTKHREESGAGGFSPFCSSQFV